jgi:hypothetical protein
MSGQPLNLSEQDSVLLDQVDRILSGRGSDDTSADPLGRFCAALAQATPSARDQFRRDLGSRLTAELARQVSPAEASTSLRSRSRWRRALVGTVAAALLLAVGLAVAVPSVRAGVSKFTHLLGAVLVNGPLDMHVTSTGYEPSPGVSIAEALRLAAFPVHLPTWLPDDMELSGAYAVTDTQKAPGSAGSANDVGFVYFVRGHPHEPPVVTLNLYPVDTDGGLIVDASKVKQITVKGKPALYAKGAYNERGVWDDSEYNYTLFWEEDGARYAMNAWRLPYDDMIRIAESMR